MSGERATDRVVFSVSGADRVKFLQGLVTNDLDRLPAGLIYAALLTPQGKYLADFFLAEQGEAILLDVQEILADALLQRLNMYRCGDYKDAAAGAPRPWPTAGKRPGRSAPPGPRLARLQQLARRRPFY